MQSASWGDLAGNRILLWTVGLTSSATVATVSKPTNEKYTIAAPAKMPGTPCGAKGVRLLTWPKGDPAKITYRMAIMFIPVTTAQPHNA